MKRFEVVVCCVLMVLISSVSFAIDTVYVSTTDGHLLQIGGMTAGTWNRGSAGDMTTAGFYQAGVNFLSIGAGLAGPNGDFQVVAGDNNSLVRVVDGSMQYLNTFGVTGPGQLVTSVKIGDLNGLTGAVVATHTYPSDPFGGLGSGTLAFSYDPMNNTHNYMGGNWIGGTEPTGMVLADIIPSSPGLEVLVGHTNTSNPSFSSTLLDVLTWSGSGFTVNVRAGTNNYISDVAAGDIFAGGGADYIQIGANPSGMDPSYLGDSYQAFSYDTGGHVWNHFYTNGTGADMVEGQIADVFSDPGVEFIGAGDDTIVIVNVDGDRSTFQLITVPNEYITSLITADVLGGDSGMAEIVVGTVSGKMLAFQHSVLGDDSTGFVLAATLDLGFAGGYSISDMTSVVPEPMTILLLSGGFALSRRRRSGR